MKKWEAFVKVETWVSIGYVGAEDYSTAMGLAEQIDHDSLFTIEQADDTLELSHEKGKAVYDVNSV